MSKATLWRIEYVGNSQGVWEAMWFATYEEAKAEFDLLVKCRRYQPTDEPCGEYGEILAPQKVVVELTPEGVLAFANEYALGLAE